MSLLDATKLLLKKKTEMAKANAKLRFNLEKERLFFNIPEKITLLKILSLSILDLIIKSTLTVAATKENTKNFLRTNKRTKSILDYTSTEYEEDNLSEILLECYSENSSKNIPEINENLDANDILKTISGLNNIDKKINITKIKRLNNKIKNIVEVETVNSKILSYSYLLFHIITITKDLFTTYEHPSPYRVKYLQKLIRNIYALMKDEYDSIQTNARSEYEKIINALKQIDDILIAVTLVTTIYIKNRLVLAERSKEAGKEIVKDFACITEVLETIDIPIEKKPFEINLNCPVTTDDTVVPHVPIEEKLKNLTCEIYQNEQTIVDGEAKEDLATIAVIRNNKKNENLNPLITIDSFVNSKTILGSLGSETQLYSPIDGYVDKISTNEIIVRDMSDPEEDYLTTQLNLLNKKYERLNYVKSFLKDTYIGTLYPMMLSTAIVDDASTANIFISVKPIFKNTREDFFDVNEIYEKQVKQITGKDNIEMHAKNETLVKIKESLEKAQEIFYNNVKLIGETAINKATKIKTKPEENELFEFYVLDLGGPLNALENPNEIEIEFRDSINEIIRKRYVIENYQQEYLLKKIKDFLKDLEKGSTNGDLLIQEMNNVYNVKKSIIDVKNWAKGIGDKNSKLETLEKTALINKIMFLFDLILNTDEIVKKYKSIKPKNKNEKEQLFKNETIKEGNYIANFTLKLWKEYIQILKDIQEIEKKIDELSLLTTYSIIDYEGKQARLYTLNDESNCESSEEDPYINPKSKNDFKSIQYWLKYCSFATLASVANPATGWSTGWITPTPIMFPVVYIPIKAITTKYGFIVVGLTICGIFPFPFVLMSNLSMNYALPFLDPTIMLKKEIQALKKELSEQIVNLKKVAIKPIIEKTKKEIEQSTKEIKDIKFKIQDNKNLKPSKYIKTDILDFELGIQQNINYADELSNWTKAQASTQELLVTAKIKLWKLEAKCYILQEAYKIGKSVKGSTDALEQTENLINNKLTQLKNLVDNLSKVMAALPISLAPETANFAITIKNTKPVINITDELDDNVNTDVLDKFTEKFRLKNSDFLSANYESKLSDSIVNFKSYKKQLSSSMSLFVKKDVFPKYENLKITNVPWMSFLYKDFVKTGATAFGFPGQSPLPIT